MSVVQIIAAVVALLIAGGAVWRRRSLSGERFVILLLVALALVVYASGLLSLLPDPKKLIGDIAARLGPWTYALVGVMAFLETGAFVGLIAPGETVVIAGGVIAGQGEIALIPLIGLVWVCAVLGDSTSFLIGRRLGRGFLERHGPRFKITEERLQQVERYFERHGGKTILIGRFIGLVRALAPFIAGSSGLAYRRFFPYSVIGTGLWSAIFCTLGYIFWRSFDKVAHIAGQAIFGFGITVAVVVGIVMAYKRRHEIADWLRANRERPLVRPLFVLGAPVYRTIGRPLVRVAAPRVRFLWQRLTPGDLGLELSTCVAVAAAGLFVFVLNTSHFANDISATRLDRELLDLGDRVRPDFVVEPIKLVSHLGSLAAVATLLVITSAVLVSRRRLPEAAVLMGGLALIYIGVQATKAGIDRPRPAGPLVKTTTSAYPSGHAAYATAWIAVAVVWTRRLGLVGYATLVPIAIAIAAAVGVSRVYLRAHYPSDVAGGWGLGVGTYAALAAIALIVFYIRHNGMSSAPTATPVGARRQ